MRVGVVTDAQEFAEARRPAYKLWIDFGPLGTKRSSAQVTRYYRPADLVGRRVIAVGELSAQADRSVRVRGAGAGRV